MLLIAQGLTKYFPLSQGFFQQKPMMMKALENVTFYLKKGETLGVMGESGSGKTTLARIITNVIKPSSGSIQFSEEIVQRKRDIQLIFQNPYESLDPKMTIEGSLAEPLKVQGDVKDLKNRILQKLNLVGLSSDALTRLPHQFSGGQRQKIVIARAILPQPKLLVCDEPTSSLDLLVQAQIVNLLLDLKEHLHMSMIFISHNLNLLRIISDRILVLYSGIIVEQGPVEILTRLGAHPYTKALLEASKNIREGSSSEFQKEPLSVSFGCPYFKSCNQGTKKCEMTIPGLATIGKEHEVACFYPCNS